MLQKKIIEEVLDKVTGYTFKLTYWDGQEKLFQNGSDSSPQFEIIIAEKLDLKEIAKSPELKLGEAYMEGKIDIKGDLRDILVAGAKNISQLSSNEKEQYHDEFMERQKKTSRSGQEEKVQHHYDIGNDFFSLWQDETMTYSCAYFSSPQDNLKKAQLQKIDHILTKLNLKPGEKILDIGCGWGELPIRAAEQYDVQALGITLSEEQFQKGQEKVAARNVTDKVTIRCQDYRDLVKEEPVFDKIVSVGMFEHVGRKYIPVYFEAVNKMLKEGGLSLLHTITHQKEDPSHPWLEKYIFPWGYIPSLREVIWELPNFDFRLIDAENIRRHYALTADNWFENFQQARPQITDKFDEKFARMWELFLAGVVATFRYLGTSVHQLLFVKGINNNLPLTRDYMYK